MSHWIAIAMLAIVCGLLVFTDEPGSLIGLEDDELGRLVWAIALLAVIGTALLSSYRGRAGLAVKQGLVWVGIGLGLMVTYSYRAEFKALGTRLAGELIPGTPTPVQPRDASDARGTAVAISADDRGRFVINTRVNGTHVEMIADTGATVVTLTDEDARRIGIEMNNLRYSVPVQTANGRTMSAAVRLERIEVGPVQVENIRALVARPGTLNTSLLGMSFLGALRSFEFSGSRLMLRQ